MNFKKIYLCLFSLFLSTTILAKSNDEISITSDIADSYLACYALSPLSKNECVNKLNFKYIPTENQEDEQFIKEFQYNAEKQGFKNFLVHLNLECLNITEGPLYNNLEKAYEVKCLPDKKYLMSYDYLNNKWIFIKNNNK